MGAANENSDPVRGSRIVMVCWGHGESVAVFLIQSQFSSFELAVYWPRELDEPPNPRPGVGKLWPWGQIRPTPCFCK